MNNYLEYVERSIDTFIRSDKRRIDCIKVIEAIVFLANNRRNPEDRYFFNKEFSLQDILGDIYSKMDNKNREMIYKIFLEEVKLCYLGIEYVNEDRFKIVRYTKLNNDNGEHKEKEFLEILKMIEHRDKAGMIADELIKYIHRFYFIGYEFSLERIFVKNNWGKLDPQIKSEMGAAFSAKVALKLYGINHLFTSGGVYKVDDFGRNMYIITNYSSI